ncbi:aminoglycoside phosphotransferase family protein [Halomonas sp. BC04]|uniref:aminoglycoside phosphotransferase family protein n=1 Tax=Halomonas sp. BC04 TaxID=1403540 RepID=UPI0003ED78A2|nr:aminoglycoside phosphotransferase family protein [Halomonas sp. BC04]EWH01409.1 aminoglycoside phosphotransferase [Halomonas sp. BC04]
MPNSLVARLQAALSLAGRQQGIHSIRLMDDTGLAHHHLWLSRDGDDWVARLPKQSQLGLDAQANLAYQSACFARASESGHTPMLHDVLPPSDALPRGGLLVAAIRGRAARLPDDLPAIAEALAGLHALQIPPRAQRLPLHAPDNPWPAVCKEIETQARWMARADLDPVVRKSIEAELNVLPDTLPEAESKLISFDAHPGNFLITDTGQAVLVDLEKCRYGLPGFDLAHASLYTSTTWDLNSRAVLEVGEVVEFYRHWQRAMGEEPGAQSSRATLLACRRAMWLWSLTWCAKWRAQHGKTRDASVIGEDWSAELSSDALVDHVRERVEHYLTPSIIERVKAELSDLNDALAQSRE